MTFKIAGTRPVWVLLAATTIAACSGLAACSQQPAPTPAQPAPDPHAAIQGAWSSYAARFIEDYFKLDPFFAVQSGRHEFDGQMTDYSAAALAKRIGWLKMARKEADAFDTSALTPEQNFEREYVMHVIDAEVFWLDRAHSPQRNPAWYSDRLDPEVYLSRDYAPLDKRMKGYIGYARGVPKTA